MGSVNAYALGRLVQATLTDGVTFNTATAAAAGDSAKILSYDFTGGEDRTVRRDAGGTNSALEMVQGRHSAAGTFKSWLNGRGGATPPDIGVALKCLFGSETIAADVTYALTEVQALPFFDMRCESSGVSMESLISAFVKSGKFTISGTADPEVEFTLGASRHIFTGGNSTANGDGVASQSLIVQDGESYNFEADGYIYVGSTAQVSLITSINHATHTLTLASALTWSDNDIVRPYNAWAEASTGGSPAALISGSIALGADSDVPIVGLEFTIDNDVAEHNDYAFRDRTVDFDTGDRMVTGKVTLKARDADMIKLLKTKQFNTAGVNPMTGGSGMVVVCGPSTATWTFTFPKPFFDYGKLSIPERKHGTIELPFTALSTGAAQLDEVSLVTAGS